MIRLAVTGGRHYGVVIIPPNTPASKIKEIEAKAELERSKVILTLDFIHRVDGISLLIHGAANGADNLCLKWAEANGVEHKPFYANWYPDGKLDKGAGPKRNQRMVDEGNITKLVAFPGNRGTADMVSRCRKGGIPVEFSEDIIGRLK